MNQIDFLSLKSDDSLPNPSWRHQVCFLYMLKKDREAATKILYPLTPQICLKRSNNEVIQSGSILA